MSEAYDAGQFRKEVAMTKKSSRTRSGIRGSKKQVAKAVTVKDLSPKSDVRRAVTAGGMGTGGGLRGSGSTNDNVTLVRARAMCA